MTYSKVVVLGRCGRDPEMRYTQAGRAVADVSLAEDRGYGDNKRTIWWRLSVWGDHAEKFNTHVKKGSLLLVDGQADVSAYLGQDGQPRASLELNVHSWRFAGGKRDDEAESDAPGESSDLPF